MGRFALNTAVGFQNDGVHRIVDSKAMRKVDVGQDIVTVVEGPGSLLGAGGSIINSFDRLLVKLH